MLKVCRKMEKEKERWQVSQGVVLPPWEEKKRTAMREARERT